MRKSKPCESELVQLAGSIGQLNWLYIAPEKDFAKRMPNLYRDLKARGMGYEQIRGHCIKKMENSVDFQRKSIGHKLILLGVKKSDGLARWCLEAA